ncbi:MAG: TIGR04452 family lipoprotein [Spirochaetales bacterium]|nr:TIGR04452 family lipoprotein [Spirochaetales bacterium]
MRIARKLIPALGAGLVCGCLITSNMGLAPLDSVSGIDSRSRIKQSVHTGFLTGVLGFCTDLSSYSDFNCLDAVGISAFYGSLATSLLIPQMRRIDSQAFYTERSIQRCERTLSIETTLLTDQFLKGKVSCNKSTNTCSIDRTLLLDAAIVPVLRSSSSCDPVRTGSILSFYDINF